MCSEEVFLWVFILLFYHYFLCSFVYILFIYTSSRFSTFMNTCFQYKHHLVN